MDVSSSSWSMDASSSYAKHVILDKLLQTFGSHEIDRDLGFRV
jgi:hypothetical protein